MKKNQIFISEDGITFDNAKKCADHEFKTIDGLIDKINQKMENKNGSHQLRWCNSSGPCACMGCINYEFAELGLTKEHWEVWVESYRQPKIYDENDPVFGLYLEEDMPSTNSILNLIKVLKEKLFHDFNFVQIRKKIEASKTEGKPLYEFHSYNDSISLKEKLDEIGMKFIIKRNGIPLEEIQEHKKIRIR